jgi:nucleoside-diphosphate-sugar epimerase
MRPRMAEAVILFGATGFVGRNLVDWLVRRDIPVIAVSQSGRPVPGARQSLEMSEIATLPTLPKDTVVINVAATRYDVGRFDMAQSDIILANTDIVNKVYAFCLERGIREVRAASSVAVYEAGLPVMDDRVPVDLNRPPNANEAFYAWSKRWGEVVAELNRARFGISTVSLRLSNPYGRYDSTDMKHAHVAPAFVMRAILPGEAFTIKGNPNVERDFIYIDDVCEVFEKTLEWRETSMAMNLCSGRTNTLLELAQEALKARGDTRPIVANDTTVTGVAARRSLNQTVIEKTKKIHFATLAEGLPPTLEWYADALAKA